MTARAPTLIDRFYLAPDARTRWEDEVARRAEGITLTLTRDYFWHMNPLFEPNLAMQYIVGRYEAAFDAIAEIRPKSVLEIGCAHGLSSWLMTSWADEVVGLDLNATRVEVGSKLFPEIKMVAADWRTYLETSGRRFDAIVCSHGPVHWDDLLAKHCDHYFYIGYRTDSWGKALVGGHKISGRQLSFSTTHWTQGARGLGVRYFRYFLRRNWLKETRHALSNGNALPL